MPNCQSLSPPIPIKISVGVPLNSADEINEKLVSYIKKAYDAAGQRETISAPRN